MDDVTYCIVYYKWFEWKVSHNSWAFEYWSIDRKYGLGGGSMPLEAS